VALLIARAQAYAPGLFVVRITENARDFGREIVADAIRRVVHGFRADVDDHAVIVERPRSAYVDARTDAAGGDVRAAGLVDLQSADAFRGEIRKIE
jgi:hypothetical protein